MKRLKKEKVAVCIDGSNFYNYLKDKSIKFLKGNKFDFKNFIDSLIGNRACVSKRYYVGVIRNTDLLLSKDINNFKEN